jgi:hypothetical protein
MSMCAKLTARAKWFSAACVVLSLTGCCLFPPGKGPQARAGYRAAAPVIAALESFHTDQGHYPSGLGELVPACLPHQPTRTLAYSYASDEDTYTLRFAYSGPCIGMTIVCTIPERERGRRMAIIDECVLRIEHRCPVRRTAARPDRLRAPTRRTQSVLAPQRRCRPTSPGRRHQSLSATSRDEILTQMNYMKSTQKLSLVLAATLLLAGCCSTRSISHSDYRKESTVCGYTPTDGASDPGFAYKGELSEFDVLGIDNHQFNEVRPTLARHFCFPS